MSLAPWDKAPIESALFIFVSNRSSYFLSTYRDDLLSNWFCHHLELGPYRENHIDISVKSQFVFLINLLEMISFQTGFVTIWN